MTKKASYVFLCTNRGSSGISYILLHWEITTCNTRLVEQRTDIDAVAPKISITDWHLVNTLVYGAQAKLNYVNDIELW